MNGIPYTLTWILIIFFVVPGATMAGEYYEHRKIGDVAFKKWSSQIEHNPLSKFDIASESGELNIPVDPWVSDPVSVSYGSLNALSGDHSHNPTELVRDLINPHSRLNNILNYFDSRSILDPNRLNHDLHNIDNQYLELALENQSHFYEYSKSFAEHYQDDMAHLAPKEAFKYEYRGAHFNRRRVKNSVDVDDIYEINLHYPTRLTWLHNTNAIFAYTYLHRDAVKNAFIAGSFEMLGHKKQVKQALLKSLLINAFADHFLQDCFSSGHLLVNRSVINSATKDKQIHDFFSRYGLNVVNYAGNTWRAYGDANMHYHTEPLYEQSFDDLISSFRIATTATINSLNDLLYAYQAGRSQAEVDFLSSGNIDVNNVPFLEELYTVRSDEEEYASYFLNRFSALRLIPIPFNTTFNNEKISEIKEKYKIKNSTITQFNNLTYVKYNAKSIANDIGLNARIGVGIYQQETKKTAGEYDFSVDYRGIGIDHNYSRGKPWFDVSASFLTNESYSAYMLGVAYITNAKSNLDLGARFGRYLMDNGKDGYLFALSSHTNLWRSQRSIRARTSAWIPNELPAIKGIFEVRFMREYLESSSDIYSPHYSLVLAIDIF